MHASVGGCGQRVADMQRAQGLHLIDDDDILGGLMPQTCHSVTFSLINAAAASPAAARLRVVNQRAPKVMRDEESRGVVLMIMPMTSGVGSREVSSGCKTRVAASLCFEISYVSTTIDHGPFNFEGTYGN